MSESAKQGIRLRAIIVSLVLVAFGCLTLYLSVDTDETKHPLRKSLLREFATIALIAGTLHVAYEVFQRKDYLTIIASSEKNVLDRISALELKVLSRLLIAEQANTLGLSEVRQDSNSFAFAGFLRSTKRLIVVLNDGRTWVSNHAPSLRERFEQAEVETVFFLVHPQSRYLAVLATRDSTTDAALANKINETVAMIRDMCLPTSRVKILGHHLHNPHSVYLGDREVLVTPYFHSRVRRTVPLYRFEDRTDGCFFRETMEDLRALELDSKVLFESPVLPSSPRVTTTSAATSLMQSGPHTNPPEPT